jgi:hypothetical protein
MQRDKLTGSRKVAMKGGVHHSAEDCERIVEEAMGWLWGWNGDTMLFGPDMLCHLQSPPQGAWPAGWGVQRIVEAD